MIVRTHLVKEAGWLIKDRYIQKRDAIISAGMMFIISAAVLITAATTLNLKGLRMNSVAEMIPLLEPIAGGAALTVFTIGILAAGLSSHLPNILMIPWLIIDYRNEPRNTRTTRNRIIILILCIISVTGVAFNLRPVFLLLLSQASIAIMLPVSIAALFILTSRKKLMGENVNQPVDYILLALIMIFALYMCWIGINGVLSDINL
jgi:Mn2+/Fe2+ NRAMP family transporter